MLKKLLTNLALKCIKMLLFAPIVPLGSQLELYRQEEISFSYLKIKKIALWWKWLFGNVEQKQLHVWINFAFKNTKCD